MNRLHILLCCFMSTSVSIGTVRADDAGGWTLRDGDRVVLIGNTFIERDQSHGYLETMLTACFPDRNVTFRNLGWSGDTVFGEARAAFGTPEDGFRQLEEHVLALKPTVIFVGYGSNEAFDGEPGLPRFLKGLNRLLDVLDKASARVVVLSPLRQENLRPPLPDPAHHNKDVVLYRDALQQACAKRNYVFIDLYDLLWEGARWPIVHPITENGIHLSAAGYWQAARAIAAGLGLETPAWSVELGSDGKVVQALGTALSNVKSDANGIQFEALDTVLPALPFRPVRPSRTLALHAGTRTLRVRGLTRGAYTLTFDGTAVVVAGNDLWASGVPLPGSSAEFDQTENLRQTIIKKNLLYFYRWRPQNETYLFGFRKHEQGQNAREIPLFDPLVTEAETEIAKLRVPIKHVYKLTR